MEQENRAIPRNEVPRILFATVGLAYLLRMLMRSHRLYSQGLLPGEFNLFAYALFTVSMLATAIAIMVSRDKFDTLLLRSRTSGSVCVAVCALCYWILLIFGRAFSGHMFVGVFLIFLYAALLAICVCAWGCVLFRYRTSSALLAASIAPVVATIFTFLSVVFTVRSRIVTGIAAVLMVVCYFFAFRREPDFHPQYDFKLLKEVPVPALIVFLCGLLAASISSGMLSLDDLDPSGAIEMGIVLLIALVIGAGLSTAIVLDTSHKQINSLFLVVCTLLVFAVLLAAIGFSIYESSSRLPVNLLEAARLFCIVGCFVAVIDTMKKRMLSPSMVFGLLSILAITLPLVAWGLVAPLANTATNGLLLENQEIVLLIVSGLLIFVTFILLVPLRVQAEAEESAEPDQDDSPDVYETIANGYGLTEREREVMQLIAEGNSMRKVGELLFISLGTVQTHSKKIYKKLDIHSRQELLDLIDRHK